ncbi:sigma factor [Paenibacillus sp. LPE1-1-1.1]|uniref:sigma factor n=1 Tax=Paenibacillus sp. LPE1-1-1.1 TaxID=3135230 RepID=UPI003432F50B
MYSFVFRIVKDAMAAEEVVQELFIRVWNSADGRIGREDQQLDVYDSAQFIRGLAQKARTKTLGSP